MPMQNATCHAEDSISAPPFAEPRRLTDPPAWCEPFLREMLRQAIKHRRCNVQLACDLAGVNKDSAYTYRNGPNGRWLQIAWDLIVLDARTLHSKHR